MFLLAVRRVVILGGPVNKYPWADPHRPKAMVEIWAPTLDPGVEPCG
jgi:hypothetical protein